MNGTKKLDMAQAWREAWQLWSGNVETSLVIAGVFMLIPALIVGWFGVKLEVTNPQSLQAMIAVVNDWAASNWHWLLLSLICSLVGTMALYSLVLNPARPTVKEAIMIGVLFAPYYFLLQFITGIAFFIGLMLLIIPGLYIVTKFMLSVPVMAAENIKNPIAALGRSWQLTKGNSIMIFLFLLMLIIVAIIVMAGIEMAINVPLAFLLSSETAAPIELLVSSILQAVVSLFFMFITMAIYRQLAGDSA